MNVLFATGIHPPDIGGPATYVRHLAGELRARGIGVEVVTYGDAPAAAGDAYPVRRIARTRPLPVRYAAYAAAVRAAARGAGVVFAQDPLSSGLPAVAGARLARRPLLLKVVGDLAWEIADDLGWIADGVDAFQARRYGARVQALRRAQRAVARAAAQVIVPSRYVQRIVAGWGVPADRLQVIPNGVPPPEIPLPDRDAARRELGLDGGFVVTSIGRFIPLKRFDRLVTAVGRLRDRAPDVRLVLIGSGPAEPALRALAAATGVADRVRFAGRLPHAEVMRHLRASDLFALVSTHEGFSHVLLEAMQAGVPAMATDVGGNRETLEDGGCGRLLASAEPDAIAAAILELSRTPEERARLAAAGQARAAGSWPAMVGRTIEMLSRVHSERPR